MLTALDARSSLAVGHSPGIRGAAGRRAWRGSSRPAGRERRWSVRGSPGISAGRTRGRPPPPGSAAATGRAALTGRATPRSTAGTQSHV